MPVVPDISLGIRPPEASPTLANPLGLMSQYTQTLGAMRALRGQQEAGNIAGMGLSPQEQLERLRTNPLVMMGDPQAVNPVIASIGAQGQMANMYHDAMNNVLKTTISAVQGGPQFMRKQALAALSMYPPSIRNSISGPVNAVLDSVTDPTNLPTDPQAQKEEINRRVLGILGGVGVPSDVIHSQFGSIGIGNIGGAQTPIATPPVPGIGATPQIVGQPTAAGSAENNTGTSTGGAPLSWTGKPLEPAAEDKATGFMPVTGLGGQKGLYPAAAATNDTLVKNFAGPETEQFKNNQQLLQNLSLAHADLSRAIADGGILTPGAGGQIRSELAKTINSAFQILNPGSKPPFDPGGVAATESLAKINRQMAYGMSQTYGDTGHQAAIKIMQNAMAVPSIEQSPLGSMLILNTWEAMGHRATDEYNFKNQWMAKNQGNLNGAEAAFNREFPPEDYANKVLDNFGLNEKGQFISGAAIQQGIRSGLYSPGDVKNIIQQETINGQLDHKTARKLMISAFPGEYGSLQP